LEDHGARATDHKENLIRAKLDSPCSPAPGRHIEWRSSLANHKGFLTVAADSRVLFVDDESVIRFVTAEALRDHGFEVTEAANSDEALALFKEPDHFDILFTDVKMPGKIDGLELASMIRHLDPDIPILIASGFALNLQRRLGALSSPVIFIEKPYNLEKLVQTVTRLVEQKNH
jgi:CheY-like chemotaxis protein